LQLVEEAEEEFTNIFSSAFWVLSARWTIYESTLLRRVLAFWN
jgi:hypothetical protein